MAPPRPSEADARARRGRPHRQAPRRRIRQAPIGMAVPLRLSRDPQCFRSRPQNARSSSRRIRAPSPPCGAGRSARPLRQRPVAVLESDHHALMVLDRLLPALGRFFGDVADTVNLIIEGLVHGAQRRIGGELEELVVDVTVELDVGYGDPGSGSAPRDTVVHRTHPRDVIVGRVGQASSPASASSARMMGNSSSIRPGRRAHSRATIFGRSCTKSFRGENFHRLAERRARYVEPYAKRLLIYFFSTVSARPPGHLVQVLDGARNASFCRA